jgi:DNA-binding transcriptional regulator YhcF (GntR family)
MGARDDRGDSIAAGSAPFERDRDLLCRPSSVGQHATATKVAGQIRRAIADGEAKPGERLPPARHLAAVMHVNTNTVLRALRLLRDEGLLELRPRHGIRVSGAPERGGLLAKAIEFVQLRRESGYSRAELLDIIKNVP